MRTYPRLNNLTAFRQRYPLTQADLDESVEVINSTILLGQSWLKSAKTTSRRDYIQDVLNIEYTLEGEMLFA